MRTHEFQISLDAETLGLQRTPKAVNGNAIDLTGPLLRAIRAAKARRA